MKLTAKGIFDGNKANPNIRHKYVLDLTFDGTELDKKGKPVKFMNRLAPEEDQVFVICDHILASERSKYLAANSSGSGYADLANIVRDKVITLHNVEHPTEDREATIDDVLNAFGSPMARDMVTDIAMHLLTASTLDEEEVKN